VNGNKPWYASETVWGAFGAIAAGFGGAWYAYTQKDMNAMALALGAAFSGLAAAVGRFKAVKAIGPAK